MADPKPSKYILGGSSTELDRIHGIHESTVDHMGTLLLAPVDFSRHSLRILDSGTAGGRWLQDLQKEHQDTVAQKHEYVGTDITESFFPQGWGTSQHAAAIRYKVQDITEPWPASWAATFDVVHQRFVLGAVRSAQLDDVVARLIGLVKPGGWIQLMESDVGEAAVSEGDKDARDGAAVVWRLLRHVYEAMGVEPDVDARLRASFARAGLVHVQERRIVVPIGRARGGHGEMGRRSAETVALTARQLGLGAKHLGITTFSADELDRLPSEVLANLEEYGGSYAVYVIMGRKP